MMKTMMKLAGVTLGLTFSGCLCSDNMADLDKAKEIAEQLEEAEYEPPADGKLTEEQIEMYVAVKQKGAAIRKEALKKVEAKSEDIDEDNPLSGMAAAMGAVGHIAAAGTADLRAAKELGHNPAEFQWVEKTVLEAYHAEMIKGAAAAAKGAQAAAIASLKAQKAQLKGEQAKMIEEQIEKMEAAQAGAEEGLTDAQKANAALVTKHKDEIQKALEAMQK